jgi:hypothetical protein
MRAKMMNHVDPPIFQWFFWATLIFVAMLMAKWLFGW